MRRVVMKWLGRIGVVVLVASAMWFIGPRRAAAFDCPEPSAGPCPPLQGGPDDSCGAACRALGWQDGGTCVSGCCTCFTK
jgi:hypothetical protein